MSEENTTPIPLMFQLAWLLLYHGFGNASERKAEVVSLRKIYDNRKHR
jgi:hypothetical protein